jgi:hypothetical protein
MSMSKVAMSWNVRSEVVAPYAATHSRSSTGSPPWTGTFRNVCPLSVEWATATEPKLRLAT